MKQTVKAILILINLFFTFSLANSEADKLTNEYLKNQEIHKAKARELTSKEIYENILLSLRLVPQNQSFEDTFLDKNMQESSAYLIVLMERCENNETEAAFYYANIEWKSCSLLKEHYKGNTEAVKQCFDTVLDGFKIASNNGIAAASYNIGVMYKEGLGVNKSNMVASKWYTLAAEQYRDMNLEDDFLDSLENALKLMPDNPKATVLKKAYLNK